MKTTAPEAELTFTTLDDSRFPYLLFFCVVGSLLAHAATFVLFRVVYPQRVTIPQPAPHVSLLTPSSPENIALLRWIAAEDPALVANDNPAAPPGLATVRYRPSFAFSRTAPLGAPIETIPAVRFPRAEDRLAPSGSAKTPARIPATVQAARTSVTYSGALAARAPEKPLPGAFSYRATTPVEQTTLLVGVNNRGEVRFSVLQQSCGDPDLDELAAAQLRAVAFAVAEAPITWGFATFTWGGDVYAPASVDP